MVRMDGTDSASLAPSIYTRLQSFSSPRLGLHHRFPQGWNRFYQGFAIDMVATAMQTGRKLCENFVRGSVRGFGPASADSLRTCAKSAITNRTRFGAPERCGYGHATP
jgi:hypothetical protein